MNPFECHEYPTRDTGFCQSQPTFEVNDDTVRHCDWWLARRADDRMNGGRRKINDFGVCENSIWINFKVMVHRFVYNFRLSDISATIHLLTLPAQKDSDAHCRTAK